MAGCLVCRSSRMENLRTITRPKTGYSLLNCAVVSKPIFSQIFNPLSAKIFSWAICSGTLFSHQNDFMGQGEEVLAFANAWPGQVISISSFVRKKGGHRDFIRLGTVPIRMRHNRGHWPLTASAHDYSGTAES